MTRPADGDAVLRPLLAFSALALCAFMLAPTVMSVQERVEELDIKRELPWRLWKWDKDPAPPDLTPPDCDYQKYNLTSEITRWPPRITKNETFTVGGHVGVVEKGGAGIAGIEVDVFLNETKEEPGVFLGATETGGDGGFEIQAKIPFELGATKYHLVAHAHEKRRGCEHYLEHWSDPEMEVVSDTRIELDLPSRAVVGRNVTVGGRLLDGVGAPVRNATVDLLLDGEAHRLVTDGDGRFLLTYVPREGGEVAVEAEFDATEYYGGSEARGAYQVRPEDVALDDADGSFGLEFVRSAPRDVTGQVLLAEGVETGAPVRLTFDGIRVATCDGCPPKESIVVETDEEGRFSTRLVVPSSEPHGPFRVTFTEGGLKGSVAYNGTVFVLVSLNLDAHGAGFFQRAFEGEAVAVNDRGEPVRGEVLVLGPEERRDGELDANGTLRFQSAADCGFHPVRATYVGPEHHLAAETETKVGVCGILAYLPAWMLDTPWWGWLLLAGALVGLAALARALHQRYAPTISRGPPVSLRFTHTDEMPEVAGVGDTVLLAATLDGGPLPEGHALRMGVHGDMRDAEVGDDLSATLPFVPDRRGDFPLRAEIVNAKGRVVTRRTLTLHVVRYAEEIETRYRQIKRERLGEASDRVSPREFEAWLRERSPDLDPDTVRALVRMFEEADYGPREASRSEFLAYMRAERGARGVRTGGA